MPPEIPLPAGRPRVLLAGTRRSDLEADLLELEVAEQLGHPARCRLVLNNWHPDGRGRPGHRYFAPDGPAHGESLEVQVEYRGSPVRIFAGRVTALGGIYARDAAPAFEIRAQDPLEALTRYVRSRVFEDSSAGDLAQAMAGEHGLSAVVELADDVAEVRVQMQASDLHFLREQIRGAGGDIWVRDGRLYALTRGKSAETGVSLDLGEELNHCRVLADVADQVSDLEVRGWDQVAAQSVVGRADASALGGPGGTDGGGLLAATLGPGEWQGARSAAGSQAAADRLAASYYRERTGRFVRASASGPGLPQLWASRCVKLGGLGDWFDGEYQIRALRHRFDPEAGYRTDLEMERPNWTVKRLRRRPDDDRRRTRGPIRNPRDPG